MEHESPENPLERLGLRTRESYFGSAQQKALETGFIREHEIPEFLGRYMTPIYDAYLATVEELATSTQDEQVLRDTVRNMNACLDRTLRIGSTEPENILRGMGDVVRDLESKGQDKAWYGCSQVYEATGAVLFPSPKR